MEKNLYGTVAALSWVIGHYFYSCKHYTYLAGEFYPYKLKNPRSSNPYKIYQDFYEPWRDQDQYSRFIDAYRLALWGGVEAKRKQGVIEEPLANRLKHICNRINIAFFYPIVCRVKTNRIDQKRLEVASSGLVGSSEYLVKDLDDSEIDEFLFLDYDEDDDFERLVREEYKSFRQNGNYYTQPTEALTILERRCDSGGIRLPFSAT